MLLAFPVMLSQAGQIMVGIVDNLMIGQLGAIPLAAASFTNAIFFAVMFFGTGIASGLTPLIGIALGEKDNEKIGRYLKNGLFITSITGIVLCGFLVAITPLFPWMGQDSEMLEQAMPYYFLLAASIIPYMLFYNFKQFNEGVASTKPAMYITLTSNVINVVLNYGLIYGELGFPAMGLTGAGIATLISRVFMGVGLFVFTYSAPYFQPFIQEMKHTRIRLDKCLEILKIGIPIAGQMVMEILLFTVGAIMIGTISPIDLAAHQIVITLAALTYMIANGLSAATTIRVSNQLGQRDWLNMRRAAHSGQIMVLAFMTISAAVFVLFRYSLPDLFVNDEDAQVIIVAAELMIIASLFQLFDGLQVLVLGALRGIKDMKQPTIITFIAYWVIALPACYLLGFYFNLGTNGVWYGFLIGLGAAAIMLLIRFEIRSKQLIRAGKKSDEETAAV